MANDFEPDERWKQELRKRIEAGLTPTVEKAKRDYINHIQAGILDKSIIDGDHEEFMNGVRRIAQEQFLIALERERQELRLACGGEDVDSKLKDAMRDEQQAILDAIRSRNAHAIPVPRQASQWREDTFDSSVPERTRKPSMGLSESVSEDHHSFRPSERRPSFSRTTDSPIRAKPEFWFPSTTPSKEAQTSRTLAYAGGIPMPKPRRDSTAANSVPATIPEQGYSYESSHFRNTPPRARVPSQDGDTILVPRRVRKASASDDRVLAGHTSEGDTILVPRQKMRRGSASEERALASHTYAEARKVANSTPPPVSASSFTPADAFPAYYGSAPRRPSLTSRPIDIPRVQPSPVPRVQPSPVPRVQPSPVPRSYQPSPIPRSYQPSPIPRSYQPSPVPRSYQPSPGPRSYYIPPRTTETPEPIKHKRSRSAQLDKVVSSMRSLLHRKAS